jgi:hypothetical protein
MRTLRWYKKAIENDMMHSAALSNYARLLATHYNDRLVEWFCGLCVPYYSMRIGRQARLHAANMSSYTRVQ